jgi:RNA polymerase sigma-70 factor (ECF subfamily)
VHEGLRRQRAIDHSRRRDVEAIEARLARLLVDQDWKAAATEIIRSYGPELLGYLVMIIGNEDEARDVFSELCEELWRGLPLFERRCFVRGWAYILARNSAMRSLRNPYRKRRRRLRTSEASRLSQDVISTSVFELDAKMARLRSRLDADEHTLLILRIDREMSWREIATVLSGDVGASVSDAVVRKRFERLKEKLRAIARLEGLVE